MKRVNNIKENYVHNLEGAFIPSLVLAVMEPAPTRQLKDFDSVLRLLTGSSNEERVAGLLIASKIFDKLKSSISIDMVNKILVSIINAVSAKFIMRMLRTRSDPSEGQLRATAMYILRTASESVDPCALFIPCYSILIEELIVKQVSDAIFDFSSNSSPYHLYRRKLIFLM